MIAVRRILIHECKHGEHGIIEIKELAVKELLICILPTIDTANANLTSSVVMRVSQGFWGTREHWQNIEGNKGTLANFWEQGNKIRKITVRKHSERVWEHGNIGQFWKGTREQGPPLGDPQSCPDRSAISLR